MSRIGFKLKKQARKLRNSIAPVVGESTPGNIGIFKLKASNAKQNFLCLAGSYWSRHELRDIARQNFSHRSLFVTTLDDLDCSGNSKKKAIS